MGFRKLYKQGPRQMHEQFTYCRRNNYYPRAELVEILITIMETKFQQSWKISATKLAQLILALYFIQGSFATDTSNPCGSRNWQIFGDGKCISIEDRGQDPGKFLSYYGAANICKKIHPMATLPTIESPEEQTFLSDLIPSKRIWLGAKKQNSSITWGKFCLIMGDAGEHGQGKWSFTNCDRRYKVSVICQKPRVRAPPRIILKHAQSNLRARDLLTTRILKATSTVSTPLTDYQRELANVKRQLEVQSRVTSTIVENGSFLNRVRTVIRTLQELTSVD